MSVTFPHRDYEGGTIDPWIVSVAGTVTLETVAPLLGTGSAKVVTAGGAAFEGISSGTGTADDMFVVVSALTAYTLSVFMQATATGAALRPRVTERTATTGGSGTNITFANITPADAATTRYSWTWTTGATAVALRDIRMFTATTQTRTFYVDGWQLDAGPTALPYDGADGVVMQGLGAGVGVSQPLVPGVRARV